MSDFGDCTGDASDNAALTRPCADMDFKDKAVSVPETPRLLDLRTYPFRIILDEIHSIGQQEGGAVWEQIILLAPCPIMYVWLRMNFQMLTLFHDQRAFGHHRIP